MMKTSAVPLMCVLLIGALLVPTGVSAQPRPAIADKIAKTYGLDSWGQIEAIRYTWNLELGKLKLARSWVWEPKTDQVSYEGKDKAGNPLKVTYLRSQLANQSAEVKGNIDPGFLNDQYTLLFPLHLVWDSGVTITDAGMQKVPLGTGKAQKVVAKYPAEGGGYTPGDTWELYVGADGRIRDLVFRHGGKVQPSVLIVTWGDQKKAGPLLVSLDKRGTADGKPLRIFYTNVAVKMVGSDTWMDAK